MSSRKNATAPKTGKKAGEAKSSKKVTEAPNPVPEPTTEDPKQTEVASEGSDTEAPKPVKKATKKTSAYNQFMKTEIPRVKLENPEIGHRDAFKKAAENWKDSADNPKNQGDK